MSGEQASGHVPILVAWRRRPRHPLPLRRSGDLAAAIGSTRGAAAMIAVAVALSSPRPHLSLVDDERRPVS